MVSGKSPSLTRSAWSTASFGIRLKQSVTSVSLKNSVPTNRGSPCKPIRSGLGPTQPCLPPHNYLFELLARMESIAQTFRRVGLAALDKAIKRRYSETNEKPRGGRMATSLELGYRTRCQVIISRDHLQLSRFDHRRNYGRRFAEQPCLVHGIRFDGNSGEGPA